MWAWMEVITEVCWRMKGWRVQPYVGPSQQWHRFSLPLGVSLHMMSGGSPSPDDVSLGILLRAGQEVKQELGAQAVRAGWRFWRTNALTNTARVMTRFYIFRALAG